MSLQLIRSKRRDPMHGSHGFSLVELMVALTGGLFMSVIVFAMARQGTRFYQQETRIAEATLAATIGMQRLRADIGRAGYMSSRLIGPNNADPDLVMDYTVSSPLLLRSMRSIQITQDATIAANADLTRAGITPDQIQLSGAYQNPDRFIAGFLQDNGTFLAIPLQPNLGALARLRYLNLAGNPVAQQNLLASLFPRGRLLRLVNQFGRVAYGLINSTDPAGDPARLLPTILLERDPAVPLQFFAGVGVEVNVVNFYRYRIADLKSDTTNKTKFGQLYNSTLATSNPADANRTELIREELNPVDGFPFADVPPEIVAEYAVDLRFEALVTPGIGPGQISLGITPAAGDVHAIAGIDPASATPQRIRSVRARLSVRSRETDRTANVPGAAPGLYRIAAGDPNAFARVRTVQADIAVPNHFPR